MRYIIRKFVEASTVEEAISKSFHTPIHDCYLKEGDEPKGEQISSAIGFSVPVDECWRADEIIARKKR